MSWQTKTASLAYKLLAYNTLRYDKEAGYEYTVCSGICMR